MQMDINAMFSNAVERAASNEFDISLIKEMLVLWEIFENMLSHVGGTCSDFNNWPFEH